MNKLHKYIIATLSIVLLISGSSAAQKYGHINLGNLVVQMPETKKADADLETYQEELYAEKEKMDHDLQKRISKVARQLQDGVIGTFQVKQQEIEFQKEQQKIDAYKQEIIQLLFNKREVLLTPIINKIKEAIKSVATQNGYVMVFDTSVFNSILFARDADDLMPLVKAKLGLD